MLRTTIKKKIASGQSESIQMTRDFSQQKMKKCSHALSARMDACISTVFGRVVFSEKSWSRLSKYEK